MGLNPCSVSCGGCERLRAEVAELRARVEALEAAMPIRAVPDYLEADEEEAE